MTEISYLRVSLDRNSIASRDGVASNKHQPMANLPLASGRSRLRLDISSIFWGSIISTN
ncbi:MULTISPECIES: hypothetical protein [unclassified Microcoleus]|uniref:hypothetical protein n=1 Tax=unclassified Microcoleus TaxID=2642155 RepID=UPI0025D5B5D2|nr:MULTISPECIES: hypothetical protein [unclassified Microcoleus]